MRIVFIGPPGSGKGTQCQRLLARYPLAHISTGEMLRNTPTDTELGLWIAELIALGNLAPDDLVMSIVRRRLEEDDCQSGCLFDGVPRTLTQAKMLDELLAESEEHIDLVLSLQVETHEILRRLTARAVIEGRRDDNTAAIEARLDLFYQRTLPTLDYYRQSGIVREIDGMRDPDEVFVSIVDAISTSAG
ncbi:adenylate kinase [Stieleria varia]|uniref:Adenylate kinase n=1 Tax=Stieleria varia TaxID=2528005 RepID=A0A5C6B1P1_9BACT|nr:adenylate kinase [Stieleria varia]TWU05501.1 adenylate kinase [Stieleria varia]